MPPKERVSRWLNEMQSVELEDPALYDMEADGEQDDEIDETLELTEIDLSRMDHVTSTNSYAWLKGAVRNRALLDYTNARAPISIRHTLAAAFPRRGGSRALQRYSVLVEML
jgi:hypothetical protein